MSKIISKTIAIFDYIDKTLIVLSVTSGAVYITCFTSFIAAPVGKTSTSFYRVFSLTAGTIEKL